MTEFDDDDLGAFEGLPEALRSLQRQSRRSVKDIAARTGISRSAVHRYLSGDNEPTLKNLGRLLEYGLGMNVLDLAEALIEATGGPPSDELMEAVRLLQLRLRMTADADPGESPSAREGRS